MLAASSPSGPRVLVLILEVCAEPALTAVVSSQGSCCSESDDDLRGLILSPELL